MDITLTEKEVENLRNILKFSIIFSYDYLDAETDEEVRQNTKDEMRFASELLEKLGVDWKALKEFFIEERDKKGLKQFALMMGRDERG